MCFKNGSMKLALKQKKMFLETSSNTKTDKHVVKYWRFSLTIKWLCCNFAFFSSQFYFILFLWALCIIELVRGWQIVMLMSFVQRTRIRLHIFGDQVLKKPKLFLPLSSHFLPWFCWKWRKQMSRKFNIHIYLETKL